MISRHSPPHASTHRPLHAPRHASIMALFLRTIIISLSLLAYQIEAHDTAEQHRIVFIKTHKTGSSTLANVMYRFGEKRKLKFMLPVDDLRLGWPQPFPGNYVHQTNVTNEEFDIVAHHSVFNHETMVNVIYTYFLFNLR